MELGGFGPCTFYYLPLVQYYFNQHTDIVVLNSTDLLKKELANRVESADLAESVELGGFGPSSFYHLPLVKMYFNQHTYVKGVKQT